MAFAVAGGDSQVPKGTHKSACVYRPVRLIARAVIKPQFGSKRLQLELGGGAMPFAMEDF